MLPRWAPPPRWRGPPAWPAAGTSADRQRQVFTEAVAAGDSREGALRQVVRALVEEFHQGF